MIRVFSMVSPRWRAILTSCDQQLTAPDCLRYRFLVASRAVRDLLLCAKHLFVAAIMAIARARVSRMSDGTVFSEQMLA